MDTSNVFVGDVYRLTQNRFDFRTLSYNYKYFQTKKNALLFRENSNVFVDVETKEQYSANINRDTKIGASFVFEGNLASLNPFLEEQYRFMDAPEEAIIGAYKKQLKKVRRRK